MSRALRGTYVRSLSHSSARSFRCAMCSRFFLRMNIAVRRRKRVSKLLRASFVAIRLLKLRQGLFGAGFSSSGNAFRDRDSNKHDGSERDLSKGLSNGYIKSISFSRSRNPTGSGLGYGGGLWGMRSRRRAHRSIFLVIHSLRVKCRTAFSTLVRCGLRSVARERVARSSGLFRTNARRRLFYKWLDSRRKSRAALTRLRVIDTLVSQDRARSALKALNRHASFGRSVAVVVTRFNLKSVFVLWMTNAVLSIRRHRIVRTCQLKYLYTLCVRVYTAWCRLTATQRRVKERFYKLKNKHESLLKAKSMRRWYVVSYPTLVKVVTHPLTHSLTYLLTYLLTHSLTHSPYRIAFVTVTHDAALSRQVLVV